MTQADDNDEKVGYGRPPQATRFKKGQSGNPKGRPRKRDGVELDLNRLLKPVVVTIGGQPREMQPKEIELRQLLDKAIKKTDLRAIEYLLGLFAQHGAIRPPPRRQVNGVVHLPNNMPTAVAHAAFAHFGPPPWKARQLTPLKRRYLAERSEADRIHDEIVGYEL
jgi:hypothetical protein